MTDALRAELGPRGISVSALHVGYMDTDRVSYIPADQKINPALVRPGPSTDCSAERPRSSPTSCPGP